MTVMYFISRQPEKLFETENLQNEVVSFWSVNMTAVLTIIMDLSGILV